MKYSKSQYLTTIINVIRLQATSKFLLCKAFPEIYAITELQVYNNDSINGTKKFRLERLVYLLTSPNPNKNRNKTSKRKLQQQQRDVLKQFPNRF